MLSGKALRLLRVCLRDLTMERTCRKCKLESAGLFDIARVFQTEQSFNNT